MSFMREDVRKWLRALAEVKDDPVLADMEREASDGGFPIVGPEVGRLLFQLTSAAGARRVFELGSGFGYSTLWFARAVGEGGRVYHTDGERENSGRAREFLGRAGVLDRVVFSVGDARDILDATPGEFDLLFMDIEKDQYPDAYRRFRNRVKIGGLVVVDNLVWSGRVAEGDDDAMTRGVQEYLDLMWNDENFLSSLMPVRDGVGVSLRVR
jgi:predicted O-methyltransferase YrrM